jgi:UTP-glucose-1-phosphate uridylyltransferase
MSSLSSEPALSAPVTIAVIPTVFRPRLLPECKAVPIELLPLGGAPTIERLVDALAASSITDVVLVTNTANRAIEDHFDRDLELERRLAEDDDRIGLVAVRRAATHPQIVSVRQTHGSSAGDAILRVRRHVGTTSFVFADPTRLVLDDAWLIAGLIENTMACGRSTVAVEPTIDLDHPSPPDLSRLGRAVLAPGIFEALAGADGSADRLGDALATLHRHGQVDLVVTTSPTFDLADRHDRLRAELALLLSDPMAGGDTESIISDALASRHAMLAV